MTGRDSRHVVEQFWAAMNTNDFHAAAKWLHEDYVLKWPQSGERIRGRENFAEINERYPAAGPWQFTLKRLVEDEHCVVTDVSVTDGQLKATVITFSDVQDGRIIRQIEYWPDPFAAPAWRSQWVETD